MSFTETSRNALQVSLRFICVEADDLKQAVAARQHSGLLQDLVSFRADPRVYQR